MTRFATRCRVIYCDPAEIERDAAEVQLAERPGAPGVRVVRMLFPDTLLDTPGHSYLELWRRVLPQLLAAAGLLADGLTRLRLPLPVSAFTETTWLMEHI